MWTEKDVINIEMALGEKKVPHPCASVTVLSPSLHHAPPRVPVARSKDGAEAALWCIIRHSEQTSLVDQRASCSTQMSLGSSRWWRPASPPATQCATWDRATRRNYRPCQVTNAQICYRLQNFPSIVTLIYSSHGYMQVADTSSNNAGEHAHTHAPTQRQKDSK